VLLVGTRLRRVCRSTKSPASRDDHASETERTRRRVGQAYPTPRSLDSR
jgi:hypothetical protein